MLGMFTYVRLIGLVGMGLAVWFLYGWGHQVIANYTEMPKTIQRLERDKALLESRVTSYQTLMARRDAAIEASKCKAQIQHWIKNPDEMPTKFDPFNQLR